MRTQKILKGELVKAKSWELLPKFPYTAGKREEVSYKDLGPSGFLALLQICANLSHTMWIRAREF